MTPRRFSDRPSRSAFRCYSTGRRSSRSPSSFGRSHPRSPSPSGRPNGSPVRVRLSRWRRSTRTSPYSYGRSYQRARWLPRNACHRYRRIYSSDRRHRSIRYCAASFDAKTTRRARKRPSGSSIRSILLHLVSSISRSLQKKQSRLKSRAKPCLSDHRRRQLGNRHWSRD